MMLTFLFMVGLRPLWLLCSSATGLCFFCVWSIGSFLGSFYFFVSGTIGVCTIFWFHWTLLLVSGIVLSKWEALLGFDHSSSMRTWNAVKRYALHFSPFYSRLSMVRRHKVQALCPVAGPLNLMFGQHHTRIVNHMALNILLPAHAPMTLQATDSFSIIACLVLCKGLCQVFDDLVIMLLISSLLPSCFQLGQPLCTTNSWFFSIHWICSLVSSVRNETAYCIDALRFLEDLVIPRYLLSSPLTWLLPRSEELRQGIFADYVLQRTTLFSSLVFFILDCNVSVSFWNTLDCNKVFCMVFISSWCNIYVMFSLILARFIVFSRVLHIVVERYVLQFFIFLSSLSMVRGHKAQALWPMASPRNLLSEQHFSCIVQHMVWNILFLYFVWYGHNGLLKNFLCGWRSWSLFSFLSPLNFAFGIGLELMQFRGLLIYSNLKIMLLNDSFGSLGTIFAKFPHIF